MAGPRRPAGAARPTTRSADRTRPGNGRRHERSGARAMDRVDGPRGQRDGDTVVRRRERRGGRRRMLSLLAPLVLVVGVTLVAVFPLQNLRNQRSATAEAQAELAEVKAERERVQRESALLETDEEIERRAREDYGYQRPGEEIYNVLPSPTDPIGLPETWPFTGVERALGAR